MSYIQNIVNIQNMVQYAWNGLIDRTPILEELELQPNHMPDMRKGVKADAATPNPRGDQFIDELAELLVPWGVPATAGRLYAYLMLSQDPVTLEQIAEDLGMSKAGAWNAARFLEQSGNARRFTERGSKRIYFLIADEMAPCMLDRLRALGDVGRLIRKSGIAVAKGSARDRLSQTAESCIAIEQTVLDVYEREYGARKATAGDEV